MEKLTYLFKVKHRYLYHPFAPLFPSLRRRGLRGGLINKIAQFKLNIVLILFLFFSICPQKAFSENSLRLNDISVSEWFSFSNSSFQISGPLGTAGTSTFVSELEFDDVNSNILAVSGEVSPFSWLAVDFSYGFGSISSGTFSDSDLISIPSLGVSDYLFSNATARVNNNKTSMISVNFYFDMLKLTKLRIKGNSKLDFFLGYMLYKDELGFVDGYQTISELPSIVSTPVGPISGLNSTYDFTWNAVRMGLRTERQYPKNIFIKGEFAYLPFIDYKGEGFWNLRTDFRSTSPNFEHNAIGFFGIDLSIILGYQPLKWFVISAGYKLLHLKTINGTDTKFLADGSSSENRFDSAKVTRHGPFVQISITR